MRKPGIFVAAFAVAALVQFALLTAPPIRVFADGLSAHLAFMSAWLIRAAGGACLHSGAVLSNAAPAFSMEVRDGCNGINVVILFWSAVLACQVNLKWKVIGLGAGLVAIEGLNLLRLISLFYLGQYNKPLFEFAHLYLWETLIIIDAIAVFGMWIRRAPLR